MRIVFAYEHSLPFVMQDPTAAGKTLSNTMKRWDKNGEISRVRSFLTYVYGIASTRSLPNDTYPIAITKGTVKAGSLILTTQKNHHSWTVKNMLSIGVPHLIYNSVVGSHSSTILQERKSWPIQSGFFRGIILPLETQVSDTGAPMSISTNRFGKFQVIAKNNTHSL